MTLTHPNLRQMREELRVGEEFLAKYNRPGPPLHKLSHSARLE